MSKKTVIQTFTCPHGHTFPATEFHSYVDMHIPEIEDAVTFFCPHGARGHGFTLRKAVAGRMLTIEQAARICAQAEILRQNDAKK